MLERRPTAPRGPGDGAVGAPVSYDEADAVAGVNPFRRNWALAMLFLAGVLNLFDRQIVNILAQPIKAELGISDAELGLLTGTAFGVLYALLGIPLGRLADRVDRARLMAVALIVWSGFTATSGAAASFVHLFLARMGVGIGEAGAQPASTALVRDLFPEGRRASAMSVLLFGAPVGGFLGLLVGGHVGSVWGWRAAFLAASVPGVLLGILILCTMRDPQARAAAESPPPPLLQTLSVLVRRSSLRWLVLGLICTTFMVYASGAWLPAFFIRAHAMKIGEIGPVAAVAVGLGGGLGALGGGVICDALRPRIHHVELKLLITALALTVPTLLVTVLVPDRTTALVSMGLFNVVAYAYLGPIVVLIQQEATPQSRALTIGLCIALANISTLGFGLPLLGALSDRLAPEYGQRALGYALAITLPLVASIGTIAFWQRARAVSAARSEDRP